MQLDKTHTALLFVNCQLSTEWIFKMFYFWIVRETDYPRLDSALYTNYWRNIRNKVVVNCTLRFDIYNFLTWNDRLFIVVDFFLSITILAWKKRYLSCEKVPVRVSLGTVTFTFVVMQVGCWPLWRSGCLIWHSSWSVLKWYQPISYLCW